jgi:rubrerythrin
VSYGKEPIMRLFDFALQMEREAADFYKRLSRASSREGYKRFFADLASDHEERLRYIKSMRSVARSSSEQLRQDFDGVRSPWRTVSQKDALAEEPAGGLEKAYQYALELEAAEIHCYRDMLKKARSGEMKNLVREIVEEENRHFETFREVYDFINAPNQYLASGEFSNLTEFHQFGRDVD